MSKKLLNKLYHKIFPKSIYFGNNAEIMSKQQKSLIGCSAARSFPQPFKIVFVRRVQVIQHISVLIVGKTLKYRDLAV